MIDHDAYILREGTGTTGVIETARLAAGRLADHQIPHLIMGGIAVQKHGNPRVIVDADLVVPDVLRAFEVLTADATERFIRLATTENRIKDRRTGAEMDFYQAGTVRMPGCHVTFPAPTVASEDLQFVELEKLISLKLDHWSRFPVRRTVDKSDVIEMILRRKLPRDLKVDQAVQKYYLETWDGLKAEP